MGFQWYVHSHPAVTEGNWRPAEEMTSLDVSTPVAKVPVSRVSGHNEHTHESKQHMLPC